MRAFRANNSFCAQGFTLIELITVITILGILAVLGSKFAINATNTYRDIQTRSRLVNTGRQAVERISRQLRTALPYSVRLTNSNNCLEFLPIVSGGNYINSVADSVNGVTPSPFISVSPHTIDFGAPQFVSIAPMSTAELYGVSPASLATLSSRTPILLNLTAAKMWQRNSAQKRFYILALPQAFCVIANQLRFYDNQDATTASVNTSSAFSIMADSISSATPFSLTAGSENRNVNVLFNMTFAYGGKSIAFNQSVMIRNVP